VHGFQWHHICSENGVALPGSQTLYISLANELHQHLVAPVAEGLSKWE